MPAAAGVSLFLQRLFRIMRPPMPNKRPGHNEGGIRKMARASNYADNRMAIIERLAEAQARHSMAPSVRDLASAMDVGVATVHSYLRQLAEEGLVEWTPNKHRSLRLTRLGIQLASSQATRSA